MDYGRESNGWRTFFEHYWFVIMMLCAGVVIFAPTFIRSRSHAHANTCINHQVQIDAAKQNWKLDHHKADSDVPTWDDLIEKGHYLPKILLCPDGGTYSIGRLDEMPRCSIPAHKPKH